MQQNAIHRIAASLIALTLITASSRAADPSDGAIELTKAWTPATSQNDAPIYMTITNHASAPDSLTRVRCPNEVADFTVKHVTDRGKAARRCAR
jgi:copper(I)-binding protein